MVKLRIFFILLSIGLLSIILLQRAAMWVPDPFTSSDERLLRALAALPGPDVAELKLAHAALSPRYDYAIFGNSRSIEVSAHHMPRDFFNFSVAGSSFRTSVSMLERLAEMGKAPQTSILQFDHPAVMHEPSGPWARNLSDRWRINVADSISTLDDGFSKDFLVLARMFVGEEWERFSSLFSLSRLRVRLHMLWPRAVPWVGTVRAFVTDGSRVPIMAHAPPPIPKHPSQQKLEVPALNRHMARLFRVSEKHGVRIIVYESPLYHDLQEHGSLWSSEEVERRRRSFVDACVRLNIDCRSSINLPQTASIWEAWEHPPGEALGVWLRGVIDQ